MCKANRRIGDIEALLIETGHYLNVLVAWAALRAPPQTEILVSIATSLVHDRYFVLNVLIQPVDCICKLLLQDVAVVSSRDRHLEFGLAGWDILSDLPEPRGFV